MDFKEKLRIYAETAVKVGANVQQGQLVVIRTVTEARELAYAVAEAAYKAGASNVEVMWMDNEINKLRHIYATKEVLGDVRDFVKEEYRDYVDRNAVFISILSSNPNLLEGIDSDKIKTGVMARSSAMKYLRSSLMSDRNSWTIIGCPNKEWAKLILKKITESVEKNFLRVVYFMICEKYGSTRKVKNKKEAKLEYIFKKNSRNEIKKIPKVFLENEEYKDVSESIKKLIDQVKKLKTKNFPNTKIRYIYDLKKDDTKTDNEKIMESINILSKMSTEEIQVLNELWGIKDKMNLSFENENKNEKFKEFFDNIFDVLEIYDFIQKDKSSSEKEDNNSGN